MVPVKKYDLAIGEKIIYKDHSIFYSILHARERKNT